MSPKRPINADVPATETDEQAAVEATVGATPAAPPPADPKPDENGAEAKAPSSPEAKEPAPAPDRRRPIPGAVKAIVALVVVAVIFIVIAVIGGSGGSTDESDSAAPTPTPTAAGGSTETPAVETSEELGYPSFATSNTTRVGGPDFQSNAAAVALAVFPSTAPSQRPAAVTLVSGEDPAIAIAASVLMASPVRAPLLYSGVGPGLPPAAQTALEALDPQGDDATDGAALLRIGHAFAPTDEKTIGVPSGSQAAQAAAIASLRDRLFGSPPRHVVIASGDEPEFAAPAAAWAARSGDPILFADSKQLPPETAAALKRHRKVPVYVLGPSSAIPPAVVKEIAAIDPHVKRVSGPNPVANAIAFARYGDGGFGWNINDPGHGFVLARDDAPFEAGAAAALSASGTWGPLLLSDSATTLPKALREYFLDVKPGYTTNPTRAFYNHVWVIGDQEAIDVNQQAEVNELAELAKIGGEG